VLPAACPVVHVRRDTLLRWARKNTTVARHPSLMDTTRRAIARAMRRWFQRCPANGGVFFFSIFVAMPMDRHPPQERNKIGSLALLVRIPHLCPPCAYMTLSPVPSELPVPFVRIPHLRTPCAFLQTSPSTPAVTCALTCALRAHSSLTRSIFLFDTQNSPLLQTRP
jgi:hypothetical protein